MHCVLRSDDLFVMQRAKDVLEAKGITCLIKNQFASGAMGEIPPQDCIPELWLLDESWAPRAERILAELDERPQQGAWHCPQCRELNEAQFAICWNCQDSRD